MMNDYVMTVRAVDSASNTFTAEVGQALFLLVPAGQLPSPSDAIDKDEWYAQVLAGAAWTNTANGEARGDILFVAHGYNMSEAEVIGRHRRLRDDLLSLAFMGIVVAFDWPSDNKALAYLSDRHKAKQTALELVTDGIAFLSGKQTPSCPINVHVLGHSTGAYVIREAFDDADDTHLPNASWSVSQVIFAAGDVSADSMSADNGGAESIYRHCVRMTNYSSRHDEALDISNVKRLGIAPRVGRIGLPSDCPSNAVNVDCTTYYEALTAPGAPILAVDQPYGFVGMQSHSWYFGNLKFTRDLFAVLIGTDRTVIKTRATNNDGTLVLR